MKAALDGLVLENKVYNVHNVCNVRQERRISFMTFLT